MKQKLCKTCVMKNIDEFHYSRTTKDRRANCCKICESSRKKESYKRNTNKAKLRSKEYYRKNKREVMDHYGKVCQCCGETRLEFLTLDHIEQDGAEHRRKMNFNNTCTGYNFYLWLRKNNWPDMGLQVLCANCNNAKGSCGQCPHVLERQMIDGLGI